jgi:PAS domain S-box-containing protein
MGQQAGSAITWKQQLDLLADAATGYALTTLDTAGRVTSWNSGARRITGYESHEAIGQHFSLFFSAEDRALGRPDAALTEAAALGRAEREGWEVRKGGGLFRAGTVLEAVRDPGGLVAGFAKITRDMSAIVDMSARKRLEERFRQAVESAPNAMVMVNHDGRIEMVNAQTERLFGYARSELLGKPVEMLLPQRFAARHPGLREAFASDPRTRPMGAGRDLYALRRDGTEFPVEIGLNPIQTEEGSLVLSAIVDISGRKLEEERIQSSLREKDVLLAEIHHRVKNNLQIVDSLLGLQAARIDDSRVIEMLRESQNRIRSMALIHQNLYESNDFAKADCRHFVEKLVPILVSSYAASPDRISVVIGAPSLRLPISLAIPCGLVVNELVSNALKHAFPGGRSGTITIDLSMDAAERATVTVSDDGIGMPPAFDAGNAETLGLRMVGMLADQLGGSLEIRPSGPTAFMLRFPLQR